jgi:hypothetical protein
MGLGRIMTMCTAVVEWTQLIVLGDFIDESLHAYTSTIQISGRDSDLLIHSTI